MIKLLTVGENGALSRVATVKANPHLGRSAAGDKAAAAEVVLVCKHFTRDAAILALGHEDDDGRSGQAASIPKMNANRHEIIE